MIGLAVKANERVIVAEFFELLKTPWEFFQSGKRYDVVICTSEELPGASMALLLVFGGEQMPIDSEEKRQIKSSTGGFVTSDEGGGFRSMGPWRLSPAAPKIS